MPRNGKPAAGNSPLYKANQMDPAICNIQIVEEVCPKVDRDLYQTEFKEALCLLQLIRVLYKYIVHETLEGVRALNRSMIPR